MTTKHAARPGQDLQGGQIPEEKWVHGDDLCDCTFQRIQEFTNPYLARTLRVRLCCIWSEIYKQFPQFVQEIPAFNNYNKSTAEKDEWVQTTQDWNGEGPMPRHIFHRQEAVRLNLPLSIVRTLLQDATPPQGLNGTKVRTLEPRVRVKSTRKEK